MFRRRLHVSWHVAACATGILIGAAVSLLVSPLVFGSLAWVIVAICLFAVACFKRTAAMLALALLAGTLVGIWRGGLELAWRSQYQSYYGQSVTVVGSVAEDTTLSPRGDQQIRLANVVIGSESLPGQVWLSSASDQDIKRGDILAAQGQLTTGFGNIPAAMFRAKVVQVWQPQPGDIARQVRDWFADGVRVAVDEPQASLGIGYLVGQRSVLPEDLSNQLQLLGLTHIVVASGYNLTILVRFARRTLARVSAYLATLGGGLLVTGFVMVTGASPSMTRAALVTGISLLAWYYGRHVHPLVLLPFVAAITVLVDPSSLWGDIGWYLSFLAFVGVIILAPLAQTFFWGKSKPGALRQVFVDTLAAQIVTLPVIALIFGQYSLLALPANLLVLPLIPLTMVLTFFAGLAGVLVPSLAQVVGWPAEAVLGYMTSVVDWLAAMPFAGGEIQFTIPMLVASYAAITLAIVLLWRATKYSFKGTSAVD